MNGSQWLDTVLAVPVIGVVTRQRLDFPALVWTLLAKMQPTWSEDGLGESSIKAVSATDVRVERGGGLYIALTPSGIVTGYTFNLVLKSNAGALPTLELPSLGKYSELQATAVQVMQDFLEVGFGVDAQYPVIRIGVLAQTRLTTSGAPPGVRGHLNGLEATLGNPLLVAESSLLALVENRGDGRDQCHHVCKLNEIDRPDDLEFSLDYQRVWEPTKPMTWGTLRTELKSAVQDANVYFEAFGSGDLSNADPSSHID